MDQSEARERVENFQKRKKEKAPKQVIGSIVELGEADGRAAAEIYRRAFAETFAAERLKSLTGSALTESARIMEELIQGDILAFPEGRATKALEPWDES